MAEGNIIGVDDGRGNVNVSFVGWPDLLFTDGPRPIGGDDKIDRKFNIVGCRGGTGIGREEFR